MRASTANAKCRKCPPCQRGVPRRGGGIQTEVASISELGIEDGAGAVFGRKCGIGKCPPCQRGVPRRGGGIQTEEVSFSEFGIEDGGWCGLRPQMLNVELGE